MFVFQNILEIGPGNGNNFEFYPRNCRVIALDRNSYFEKYFHENKSKFPNVFLEKYIIGSAEDMKQIEDHSVDVVVTTFLLCSVKNCCKTLNEIKRVLKEVCFLFSFIFIKKSQPTNTLSFRNSFTGRNIFFHGASWISTYEHKKCFSFRYSIDINTNLLPNK